MEKVCIDASLALAWLSYEKYTGAANDLLRHWQETGVELVAPSLFHAEVISVLRRQVTSNKMIPDEAEEALSICLDIPVKIVDRPDIHRTAWQLAGDFDLTVDESYYAAAAGLEDCDLWTADKKLFDAFHGKNKRIRWVGESLTPELPEKPKHTVKGHDPDIPGLWRAI